MDTVINLLKSIDFWTVVGALGSVAAAVLALFAITRFNRRSKGQVRNEEILGLVKAVEDRANSFMGQIQRDIDSMNQHGNSMPSGWRPTQDEFAQAFKLSHSEYESVAYSLSNLKSQPEMMTSRYMSIRRSYEALGPKADALMNNPSIGMKDITASVSELRKSRLAMV